MTRTADYALLEALGIKHLLGNLSTQGLIQQPLQGVPGGLYRCPHQQCPLCAQAHTTWAIAQRSAQAVMLEAREAREARYRERCQAYLAWFRAGYRQPPA